MNHGGKRKGAGRKPAPARKAITVRINVFTRESFRAYCQAAKLSQSAAFARLVTEAKTP